MERRLAAILSADMVGYSRLIAADESGTIERQKAHRSSLIDPKIAEFGGRIFKTTGDGLLVEFPSVIDAVNCAMEIQRLMPVREAENPADKRIRYRIGINLGDIVIDGDDILGEGVIIAARLEALAEPDGICISRPVHTQIRGKLPIAFDDLGERQVKNVPEPVHVFRIVLSPEGVAEESRAGLLSKRRWQAVAATLALAVLIAGGFSIFWMQQAQQPVTAQAERPSIAVLPFANRSDDREQEFFADGMTDDLITDLSTVSGLFVIAGNSVFAYKGKAVKVQQISDELGARYVLEGSVRKAADKIRINAQLIDATTGAHLWAERYDRDYKDIFSLQNEVIHRIVSAVAINLTDVEETQIARKPTENLQAYEMFLRGEQALREYSPVGVTKAISFYEQSIKEDPNFSRARAGLALANFYLLWWNYHPAGLPASLSRQLAFENAAKALALEPRNPRAYIVLAGLQMLEGEYGKAVTTAGKATDIDSNYAEGHAFRALILSYAGKHDDALRAINLAVKLDPKAPPHMDIWLGFVKFGGRDYAGAIESLENAGRRVTTSRLHLNDAHKFFLVPSYAHAGRLDDARAAVQDLTRVYANLSLAERNVNARYENADDVEHFVEGYRKAGLRQWPLGYEGATSRKLSGEKVRSRFFGSTVSGRLLPQGPGYSPMVHPSGNFAEYGNDGRAVWRNPDCVDAAKAWIENDELCHSFQHRFTGRSFCGPVYTNPIGTRERSNEFIFVSGAGVFQFSPEE